MAQSHVRKTLTSAVDRLSDKPVHLSALVEEISALEFGENAGWRWWWLGIRIPDGFGIQVYLKEAQLEELLPKILKSQYLGSLEVFPLGIPWPEIYKVDINLVPRESGAIGPNTGGSSAP